MKTYKVIAISLYKYDLRKLDAKVERLRARGFKRITRSSLIRHALEQVDPETLVEPYMGAKG